MILTSIIAVVIGLTFVWIVLSMAIIQIQEWINTRLDKRARDMEDTIHEILANRNLKAQFYDHPVIRGLTARKRKQPSEIPAWFYDYPITRGFVKERRKLPSYIPSDYFSTALFEIILTAGTESSLIQQGIYRIREDLERDAKRPKDQAVIDLLNILADMARSAAATEAGIFITNLSLALLKRNIEEFSLRYPEYKPAVDAVLTEARNLKDEIDQVLKTHGVKRETGSALNKLRYGVAALSVVSPQLSQTLSALFLEVEEYTAPGESNLARARRIVERWFNNVMDRVAGTFKRYSQVTALMIGFYLALLLNIDAIYLTQYLWQTSLVQQDLVTPTARNGVSQEQLSDDSGVVSQDPGVQVAQPSLPIGWGFTRTQSAQAFSDSSCQLFPGAGQSFGIPVIGTNMCIVPPQWNNQTNLAMKLLGIILTALAARQGAPFWFDLLKRLVNLRGTGPNPMEREVL